MKKQVSPALMAVVIVLVVVGAGFLLWRSATEKPAYPGLNAGHPAGMAVGGGQQDTASGRANMPKGEPVTYDQAKKMRIPGMNPNAAPPGAPSSPPGQ